MKGIRRYVLDPSCPNRKRLEVSENVKYIAVTSRASKLQVFKVRSGRDFTEGFLTPNLFHAISLGPWGSK